MNFRIFVEIWSFIKSLSAHNSFVWLLFSWTSWSVNQKKFGIYWLREPWRATAKACLVTKKFFFCMKATDRISSPKPPNNHWKIYWNNIGKCFHIKRSQKQTSLKWKLKILMKNCCFRSKGFLGIMRVNIGCDIFHKEMKMFWISRVIGLLMNRSPEQEFHIS